MRSSFVFYNSWWEAIKNLPRDVQGDVLTAIIEYGLSGETTEQLKPIAKAMLAMVKPQIDYNNQRFENGKKGGRPPKVKNQEETKQKPKNNQSGTSKKPNGNQEGIDAKPDAYSIIATAIDFPSEEVKSSFPSNEEKAAAICACEVGNGGLGGSSETLAEEADSANGFGNLSPDALVAGAAPEEETTTPEASQPDKIPYQEIVDMFNSICTGYPRVVKLSDSRKNKIRIRVEEMGGFARAKPMIQTIFEKMQASKFLRGDGKSGWKAYFDWVFVNDKNWVKILEGNYDNKISDNEPNTGATGTMGAIPYARQVAGDKAASREAVGQFARAVLEQYKSKAGD